MASPKSCELAEIAISLVHIFDNGAQFKVIFRRQSRLSAEQRQHAQKLAHNQELSLIQMEVLLSLEQGATWSIGQIRKQFAPLGQSEADDLLTELSSLKLASYQGRGNTRTQSWPNSVCTQTTTNSRNRADGRTTRSALYALSYKSIHQRITKLCPIK